MHLYSTLDSMKKHFFVCHASEDKDSFATPLVRALLNEGQGCYFDLKDLQIGDEFLSHLGLAISASDYIVLCITRHFLAKCAEKDSFIAFEIQKGLSERKKLLPLVRGISPGEVGRLIPGIERKLCGIIAETDDSLVDVARRILVCAGIELVHAYDAECVGMRTSYTNFVHHRNFRWSAGSGQSYLPTAFDIEYVSQAPQEIYRKIRLKSRATGKYLAALPGSAYLCAQQHADKNVAFRVYSNSADGSVRLQTASGSFVDIEPDTGDEYLYADVKSLEGAAEFHFLPLEKRTTSCALFDRDNKIALVTSNYAGRFGIRIWESGRWGQWRAIDPPNISVKAVDISPGRDRILLAVHGQRTTFARTIDYRTGSVVGDWEELADSPQFPPASGTGAANSCFLATDKRLLITLTDWYRFGNGEPWRYLGYRGDFASPMENPMADGKLWTVVKSDDGWRALGIKKNGIDDLVELPLPAPSLDRAVPNSLVTISDGHFLLLAIDPESRQGCSLKFGVNGDVGVWTLAGGQFAQDIRLLALSDREVAAIHQGPRWNAVVHWWRDGEWEKEVDLGGVFRSSIAAVCGPITGLYLFGEGTDGAIFTKWYVLGKWSAQWSRLKAPPRLARTHQ